MSIFENLLGTKTETEFFVVVSTLLNSSAIPKIRAQMTSVQNNGEVGLQLALEQTLVYRNPKNGGRVFQAETTHIFTLYQNGTLTWWMKDQPLLVGLENIKNALKNSKDSPFMQQLPSQV